MRSVCNNKSGAVEFTEFEKWWKKQSAADRSKLEHDRALSTVGQKASSFADIGFAAAGQVPILKRPDRDRFASSSDDDSDRSSDEEEEEEDEDSADDQQHRRHSGRHRSSSGSGGKPRRQRPNHRGSNSGSLVARLRPEFEAMVGWCGCGGASREALWRLLRYVVEEADRGRLSSRRLCRCIGRGGWPGCRRLRASAAAAAAVRAAEAG
eukprot:SAG22_NODE_8004_length_691_cov_1.954392_1_plen_208_part_01